MKDLLEALQPGDPDLELANAIDPVRLPAHIAIIMDGNGRWANRRSLPRVAGHRAGVGPVRSTVETCARLGVRVLTLYAFSVENWKRPRAEVETLWRLLRYYLKKELPDLQKNGIRLQAIGRLEALPLPVRRELESVIEATSANRQLLVNLAINYSGRAEIVDAINTIIENRAGEMTPMSRPMLRMTSSIKPRVFIKMLKPAASLVGIPVMRAAIMEPPSLPTIATAMMATQYVHMPGPRITLILVLRPVRAKNNGNNTTTGTNWSLLNM